MMLPFGAEVHKIHYEDYWWNELYRFDCVTYGLGYAWMQNILSQFTWTNPKLCPQPPQEQLTRLLLAFHADPDVVDSQGRTPLHHAALRGHEPRCTRW